MNQHRRTFMKTSALASAATILLPSWLAGSEKKHEIGIQLYTVRNEMEDAPERTLQAVAEIGYTNLETAGYANGKMYGFSGAKFKRIVGDLGMNNISGHIPLHVFEESFDEALDFMEASGQQYAVLPWLSPDQRSALDQYRRHAEILNKCAEKARQANVQVCYHNHDFEFQELEGKLPMNVLLDEIDPDLVKIELDLYWIIKAGLDPVDFFQANKNRIPLWHVKDMANTEAKGFAEVGTGIIDYNRIFENADVSGMKYFFVEQDQSDDPMQSIKTSFRNLTQNILE